MSHLHNNISALIDGELHGSARQRALNHARRCAECRHELKATFALKSRMTGLPVAEPSADLFMMLNGVARRDAARRPALATSLAAARSRLGPAVRKIVVGAGSMSVAVLSLAYVVGSPGTATVARVAPPVDEYTADFAGNSGLAPLADPAVEGLDGAIQPIALTVPEGFAVATARSSSTAALGDDPRAVAELQRAVDAPKRYAYDGTRLIQTFGAGTSSTMTIDVAHAPGQGTSFGAVNARPEVTATFIAQRDAVTSGSLSAGPLALLLDAYDIAIVASGSVLGRPVTVVAASRDGVVDARFWIDDATGLLLRRETFDGQRLARFTGFTAVRVSRNGFLTHLPPEFDAPVSTRVSMTAVAALNDTGWTCPGQLPGDFSLTGLEHLEGAGDVMRASYSDGLSTVSLFEQRGALDPAPLVGLSETGVAGSDVYVDYGFPTVAVWESGDLVYTVVTDAPHDIAAGIVAGLPHASRPPPTVGDRLSTGLGRLGSLLDPTS
ncbi:MAG: hypothetical protein H0V07_12710 [Propionibacteriales bacterium]|nr:hypothetical protein [Propionibacteriales bacterium]